MGIKLEIDIPEHHYNNIMAIDSMSLGRAPYKGIIMYAINAIKHGRVLKQEPTTKNNLEVEYISRSELMAILSDYYDTTLEYRSMLKEIAALPPVTPQEPRKGHWIDSSNGWMCSECNKDNTFDTNFCPNCGAKMIEPQESEDKE